MNKEIEKLIELSGQVEDLMNWNKPIGKVMKKVRDIYSKIPREKFVELSYDNQDLEYALNFI